MSTVRISTKNIKKNQIELKNTRTKISKVLNKAGEENMGDFKVVRMCSKLRDHHTYMLLCMNLMLTTKQKPIINTQTKKGEEPKPNTKDSHQILKEESKRKRNKELQKQKNTINKMAIITLNVHGLNTLIKRQCVAEWIF